MRLICLSACLVPWLLSCAGTSGAAREDFFSRLPSTDSLRVEYETAGCFHHGSYELLFEAGSRPTVEILEIKRENTTSDQEEEKRERARLGTIHLTPADLKGLDRLHRYYRADHGGGCTTSVIVVLTQLRGGKPINVEKLSDSSCGLYLKNDITTFDALIGRLKR